MKTFFLTILALSIFIPIVRAEEANEKACVVILTDSEGLTAPNPQGKTGFGETLHRHLRQKFPEVSVYSKLVGGSNVTSWSKTGRAPYEVTTIEEDGRSINQNGFNVPNGDNNIIIESIEGQLSKCAGNGPKMLYLLAGANMLWDGSSGISRNRAFLARIKGAGFHCVWIGPPQVKISHRAPKDWLENYTKLSGASAGSANYDELLESQVDEDLRKQVDRAGGCHYVSSLGATDIHKIGPDGYHYPSTATNAWAEKLIPVLDEDLLHVLHPNGSHNYVGFESNPRLN